MLSTSHADYQPDGKLPMAPSALRIEGDYKVRCCCAASLLDAFAVVVLCKAVVQGKLPLLQMSWRKLIITHCCHSDCLLDCNLPLHCRS